MNSTVPDDPQRCDLQSTTLVFACFRIFHIFLYILWINASADRGTIQAVVRAGNCAVPLQAAAPLQARVAALLRSDQKEHLDTGLLKHWRAHAACL